MDRQADAFAVALGEYGNLVRYTFPASGQTTSYGPNSDGAVRAGGPLRFHFNFDGTITDDNTSLMWEIKTDDGSIHDKDNNYTWLTTGPPYTMNGTIVTTFLATLNAGSGFAGYTDWRIPNVKELQSIVDYETVYPAVYWVFDSHCTPGCDFSDCSCTGSNAYWSSTTFATLEDGAWYMSFDHGSAEGAPKEFPLNVRAVRGGS